MPGSTIKHLIKHRERPPKPSKRWFIVWVKRIISTPSLSKILLRRVSYISKGVKLGPLSIIDGTKLNGKLNRLTVGSGCFIAKDVVIALHANVAIGNNVAINSGVKLLTGTHDVRAIDWRQKNLSIAIEDHAWIAMNAIVLPGVKIGRGAVVGAGSVVSKDVGDFDIVAGNPAKRIGARPNMEYNYAPADFVAAFEAWLGPK